MTKTKLAMGTLILLLASHPATAEDLKKLHAERLQTAFMQAQAQYLANTNSATNAWNFARTTFDLCEVATNETQRAETARLGIAACHALVTREPKSAAGHYYLAMNYGELADALAPSLAAYRLVKDVEREFKTAAELDEHFDFAGPLRNLGELYYQAPGWPLSVGSKRKAHEWLERAAALAPDYPENLLNLAEAQLKWHQAEDAEKTLQKLEQIWPAALTNFTGVAWEPSWSEWRTRRATAKKEADRFGGNGGSH